MIQTTGPASTGGISAGQLGVVNGVATLGSDGKLTAAQRPTVEASQPWDRIFSVAGDLTVSNGRVWRPPYAGTLEGVRGELLTAPSATAAILNVQKNGVSMFTTPAARPTIDANNLYGTVAVPDTQSFAAGDALRVIVEQIGSQPPAGVIVPVTGGFTNQSSATAVTTYDILRAAAAEDGDLSIICIRTTVTQVTVSSLPGWTALSAVGSGASQHHFFYRVHDSAAGPWTATFSASCSAISQRALWRGVDPADPVDVHSEVFSASATSHTPAALTTTDPDTTVTYIAYLNASRAASLPSGYTARRAFNGTGGTADSTHVADKSQAVAGSAGTDGFTLASAATAAICRVALRPIPAPVDWSPGEDLQVTLTGLRA